VVKKSDYNVLILEECQKCKQFEPDFKFKNCSFSLEYIDKDVIQTFECTRCKCTWTRKYYYE
jgi:hypothetical protein